MIITEISFGKHGLENIIMVICCRTQWVSNFNRWFLLFIFLPRHSEMHLRCSAFLRNAYLTISTNSNKFSPQQVPTVWSSVHYKCATAEPWNTLKWCYLWEPDTFIDLPSSRSPVSHTLWSGGCHWEWVTLQNFTSGSVFSGCSWLGSNFFSTWDSPLWAAVDLLLLNYLWALSPLFFKCVFWFLNICLDLSLFSCFQFPFLASEVLLNHSDIHSGFVHKIRKHIQGWKGSIYNCPYNIPVKGTSCLVLIKSIMKCFLPHSKTHSTVREFDRNIVIILNLNHC